MAARAASTTVGSVELKIVEPRNGSGPLRLGLYLHGDGAAAYKSSSALEAMLPWTDTKHGLAVSLLAPNGCSWWQTPGHDCASSVDDPDVLAENTPPLVAAVEALKKAYDLYTDRIDYYAASGGSIFLAGEWIGLEGKAYPGVFALMCGGFVASPAWSWDPADARLRDRLALYFTYGDQDFLLSDIEGSIAAFETKGFHVTEKIIPGAGHCTFDASAEAMQIWLAQ
jgi:pimeloyl-ACP methyl ester carboxylesterase